jgi:hypothetical protein
MEALGAAMALHQSTGYFRYLADCTEMTGGHTVFDLYNVVANLENYQIDPRTKEALLTVPSSATAGDVRFYETAAVNRGFTVKLFTDREAALAWLSE